MEKSKKFKKYLIYKKNSKKVKKFKNLKKNQIIYIFTYTYVHYYYYPVVGLSLTNGSPQSHLLHSNAQAPP